MRRRSSAARACMRAGISSEKSSKRRSGMALRPSALRPQPRLAAGLGELAYAQDVALALGHRDDAARIEQIEHVACLDALIVGGQGHEVAALVAVRPARRE